MTDNEIIKALECCIQSESCEDCIYRKKTNKLDVCSIRQDSLDLINRQKAEIERLTVELKAMRGAANSYKMHYNNAIKEFAERLKEKTKTHITMHIYDDGVYKPIAEIFIADMIDHLVKEMTEENNAES